MTKLGMVGSASQFSTRDSSRLTSLSAWKQMNTLYRQRINGIPSSRNRRETKLQTSMKTSHFDFRAIRGKGCPRTNRQTAQKKRRGKNSVTSEARLRTKQSILCRFDPAKRRNIRASSALVDFRFRVRERHRRWSTPRALNPGTLARTRKTHHGQRL